MNDIPQELDWVSELAKCDIKSAFDLLGTAVEKDVERYKALPRFRGQIEFSNDPNWSFSVVRHGIVMKMTVFSRVNDHIAITFSNSSHEALNVVPILTKTGHYKFQVEGEDDEPLFQWQLRRRALEPIFFGNW
jgi:hypothetical protein